MVKMDEDFYQRLMSQPFLARLFALNNVQDTSGRPLGELRASLKTRKHVAMHTKVCPYTGSRQGRPMNVSALKQVRDHWDESLEILSYWHGTALKSRGMLQPQAWYDLLYPITMALISPVVVVCRREHGDDRPCPQMATVYKIAAGLHRVVWDLVLLEANPTPQWPVPPLSCEGLLNFAETQGYMVADGEACAATDKQLLEVTHLLLGTGGSTQTPHSFASYERHAQKVSAIVHELVPMETGSYLNEIIDTLLEEEFLSYFVQKDQKSDRIAHLTPYVRQHVADLAPTLKQRFASHIQPATCENLVQAHPLLRDELALDLRLCLDTHQGPPPPQPFIEALSNIGVDFPREPSTQMWLAQFIVRHARWTSAYTSFLARAEARITLEVTSRDTNIAVENKHLFPRQHTHAWLEALSGARLYFDPESLGLDSSRGSAKFTLDSLIGAVKANTQEEKL
jgi:hypothetical protein